MISVDEALELALGLATPLPVETIALGDAGGRVLATAACAGHDQPPFAASAMDGYAVRQCDVREGAKLTLIGEAAAGAPFDRPVGPNEAVRIFTGAPIPDGADRVIIQEDVMRQGTHISLGSNLDAAAYIRPKGSDFSQGTEFGAGVRLGSAQLALLASMNVARVGVARRPEVCIIATGDELVEVGQTLKPGQIISSNSIALAEMARSEGAVARILPIATDDEASLSLAFELARDADLIVTSGGASVGDHDLVAPVAQRMGLKTEFYKVAMRPGKPLMAGKLKDAMFLGLPGNPVSAQVCGHLFMRPVLRKMQHLQDYSLRIYQAPLAEALPANGARQHYMRATLTQDGALQPAVSQDSAMSAIMAGATALIMRPPNTKPAPIGTMTPYLVL